MKGKFDKQREEFLKIIDKGGNIMEYFSKVDPICHDIGKYDDKIFQMAEKLGSGGYGEVWAINDKNLPPGLPKRMVVKSVNADVDDFEITTKENRKKVVDFFDDEIYLTDRDFGGTGSPKTIILPSFLFTPCKENLTYKRSDNGVKITLPKGSMICLSDFVEFAIGIYTGEFFLRLENPCINFLPVYYFAVCAEFNSIFANYYTFMEQIDKTFEYVLDAKRYDEKMYDHILVQALFSIAFYQHNGNIVHNDLHSGNVFLLKEIKNLKFNGVTFDKADYLEYLIRGRAIYLPGPKTDKIASQFIVKIGDWGQSVKYGAPILGDKSIIDNAFQEPKPNWYNKSYDVLTLLRHSYSNCRKPTEFMKKILLWTEKEKYVGNSMDDVLIKERIEDTSYGQYSHFVRAELLESNYAHVNPDDILLDDDLMADYLKVPPKGSVIIRCGEIFSK